MSDFLGDQVTAVREQTTEVVENVEIINTPPVAAVPEPIAVVQKQITDVQENIMVVE
jgi:hypothetical protein